MLPLSGKVRSNCAGLALGMAGVHEYETQDSVKMINTNVTAVAILTRIFAEGMKKRNRGHICESSANQCCNSSDSTPLHSSKILLSLYVLIILGWPMREYDPLSAGQHVLLVSSS